MHTHRTTYHATLCRNEEEPNMNIIIRGTSVQLLYAMPFKKVAKKGFSILKGQYIQSNTK
jgi:hypothetical protein